MTRRTLEANIKRLSFFFNRPDHSFGDMREVIDCIEMLYYLDYYLTFYGWQQEFMVYLPLKEYVELLEWTEVYESVDCDTSCAGPNAKGIYYLNEYASTDNSISISRFSFKKTDVSKISPFRTSTLSHTSSSILIFKPLLNE